MVTVLNGLQIHYWHNHDRVYIIMVESDILVVTEACTVFAQITAKSGKNGPDSEFPSKKLALSSAVYIIGGCEYTPCKFLCMDGIWFGI